MGIQAARISHPPPVGFTVVIVHGLIFEDVFFFYSMGEKLRTDYGADYNWFTDIERICNNNQMDPLQKVQN